jgi:hypothetical protein
MAQNERTCVLVAAPQSVMQDVHYIDLSPVVHRDRIPTQIGNNYIYDISKGKRRSETKGLTKLHLSDGKICEIFFVVPAIIQNDRQDYCTASRSILSSLCRGRPDRHNIIRTLDPVITHDP